MLGLYLFALTAMRAALLFIMTRVYIQSSVFRHHQM